MRINRQLGGSSGVAERLDGTYGVRAASSTAAQQRGIRGTTRHRRRDRRRLASETDLAAAIGDATDPRHGTGAGLARGEGTVSAPAAAVEPRPESRSSGRSTGWTPIRTSPRRCTGSTCTPAGRRAPLAARSGRLARIDPRQLQDRGSRRGRVDQRCIAEALGAYYGDRHGGHGRYGAGEAITSVLTHADWLDLDVPADAAERPARPSRARRPTRMSLRRRGG